MKAHGYTSTAVMATTHVQLPPPRPIRDGNRGVIRSPIKPPAGGWQGPEPITGQPAPKPKPKRRPRRDTVLSLSPRPTRDNPRRAMEGATVRLPGWDLDRAIDLAKQGMTAPDIARAVDAPSPQSVRQSLGRRGIVVTHGSTVPRRKVGKQLAAQLREAGATAADVRTWAAGQGLECRPNGLPPRHLVEGYLEYLQAAA